MTGPWIYVLLQEFIYLYYKFECQIPYSVIKTKFVDKHYELIAPSIRTNIAHKLFIFQHEIINRQDFRIDDYQYDQYDNQYVLYKHQEHTQYEDCGEIWVRQKDYALAVPLMNYSIVFDNVSLYQNDIYDTLQCDEHIQFANIWKQLCNNAVKFGIFQNTIWIVRIY